MRSSTPEPAAWVSVGLVLGLAALVAVGTWVLGFDVVHAILLGVAIAVICAAARALSSGAETREPGWEPLTADGAPPQADGGREEIADLSWAMNGAFGMVGREAEIRLRRLARRRLGLEGLDLTDPEQYPEIQQRLGSSAAKILVRENVFGVREGTLVALLDALDGLDANRYHAPTRRRRGRPAHPPERKGEP